jgi:hypothetical protein
MNLDDHASQLFAKNINMMVPYYLMAAYAYYEEDNPIFSDHFFDDMAKTMLAVWDDIEHFHKHIINIDMLEAGTFVGTYPSIVSSALKDLRQHGSKHKRKKNTKR